MANTNDNIVLGLGDIYFGQAPRKISTLLGSCVAITLWHSGLRIGGMCHVVVPDLTKLNGDTRYPNCAVRSFIKDIVSYKTHAKEYIVGIYGGGNMFPDIGIAKQKQIGYRNIECMKDIMLKSGFNVSDAHIGGNEYRRVSLCLNTGNVSVASYTVIKQEKVAANDY